MRRLFTFYGNDYFNLQIWNMNLHFCPFLFQGFSIFVTVNTYQLFYFLHVYSDYNNILYGGVWKHTIVNPKVNPEIHDAYEVGFSISVLKEK